MEYNFDKEIDTLLRQAARTGQIESSEDFDAHLDADEISMFAENALPEKARARATKHLAECTNCRTVLSNLILLNEATEDEIISTIREEKTVQTVTDVPWYKKLFVFPQIAYAMGALALVFSGAIGFLIYQTANQSGSFEMAKSEPATANANAFVMNTGGGETEFDENLSNMMSANTSGETIANSGIAPSANANISAPNMPSGKLTADEQSVQADLKTVENSRAENRPDVASRPTPESKEFSADSTNTADSVMSEPVPPPPPASAPPNSLTTRSRAESKKKSDKSSEESDQIKPAGNAATRRQIGGKTFNRINGVWIDSDYRQMGNLQLPMTTTVRRGTREYLKLDKNIRIIAEQLDGAVIIVSNGKAYRIQ